MPKSWSSINRQAIRSELKIDSKRDFFESVCSLCLDYYQLYECS